MAKTSLFGQISLIAIFGTQGVIFQKLAKSAEINAHKCSWPAFAENVVISPNPADCDFRHPRCEFPKFNWIGWN